MTVSEKDLSGDRPSRRTSRREVVFLRPAGPSRHDGPAFMGNVPRARQRGAIRRSRTALS